MSGLSEGETHVAAMRLVCQSLEDHEQQGIEIQWDVLQQMLDHMDVILQGIADQRRDDAEEIQILKKERDAAHERTSTVRDQVATEIDTLRKDRDHWRAAREDAMEAGELMQAEIVTLRQQLADAQREASDEFVERQVLTAEQDQDAEIWKQRFDWAQNEVKYLRDRLDEERSVSAGLRQKLAELDAGTTAEQQ